MDEDLMKMNITLEIGKKIKEGTIDEDLFCFSKGCVILFIYCKDVVELSWVC
jgi:hypothetical protein